MGGIRLARFVDCGDLVVVALTVSLVVGIAELRGRHGSQERAVAIDPVAGHLDGVGLIIDVVEHQHELVGRNGVDGKIADTFRDVDRILRPAVGHLVGIEQFLGEVGSLLACSGAQYFEVLQQAVVVSGKERLGPERDRLALAVEDG